MRDTFFVRAQRAENEANRILDEILSQGPKPLIKPLNLGLQNRELASAADVEALVAEIRTKLMDQIKQGVRVRLPEGQTWESLAALTPDQIREGDLFPAGFLPLPHPKQPEGGMLFPRVHIDEVLAQTGRDLTRFDLDLDLDLAAAGVANHVA